MPHTKAEMKPLPPMPRLAPNDSNGAVTRIIRLAFSLQAWTISSDVPSMGMLTVSSLKGFSSTPAEIPVLYFSGGRSLNFTEQDREALRRYLLAGGMAWFDSVVGSPYFYKSALSELRLLLPEAQLRRLPEDPWGNAYQYRRPSAHGGQFDVFSFGADGKEGGEGDDADIGNWQI